jgi:hypothetical protein
MGQFAASGKINLQKIFTGRLRGRVPAAEVVGCIPAS